MALHCHGYSSSSQPHNGCPARGCTDKAGEDSTSIAKEHIAALGNVGAKTTRLYEAIHCPSKESRSPKWANEVRWRRMLAKSTGTAQLHRCGFYFASTITHDLCFLDRAASSPCPSRGISLALARFNQRAKFRHGFATPGSFSPAPEIRFEIDFAMLQKIYGAAPERVRKCATAPQSAWALAKRSSAAHLITNTFPRVMSSARISRCACPCGTPLG